MTLALLHRSDDHHADRRTRASKPIRLGLRSTAIQWLGWFIVPFFGAEAADARDAGRTLPAPLLIADLAVVLQPRHVA